ncbi:kinocilin [Huso huso]|uniref:Kinocilin n=1 Tax=Huso huso TaxID=61971 RepID=A0ABR0ZHK7_HUSHU
MQHSPLYSTWLSLSTCVFVIAGLIISIYPFIKAWLSFNQVLPFLGNLRVHPRPNNSNIDLPAESFQREMTQGPLNQELSRSKAGAFQDKQAADTSPDEG